MHESEKWKWSRSVVSDSSRRRGLQPTRLLCPWDFLDKSPWVGCPCLLWEVPASSSWVLPSPVRAPCLLPWPHSVSYIPFPTSQALLHGRDPAGAGLHTAQCPSHARGRQSRNSWGDSDDTIEPSPSPCLFSATSLLQRSSWLNKTRNDACGSLPKPTSCRTIHL